MNASQAIKHRDLDHLKKMVAMVLKDLAKVWQPHAGQKRVGFAYFVKGIKKIFVRCGRKFGKTELAIYLLYRIALTIPNSHAYYIAPTYKQAKELVWANGRMPNFLTPELKAKYIENITESDHRITFKNGSFIKIDGSDNYEAYRGINPHAIAYDEYKDFHPKFHEAMEPNLATHQAPIFIFGTPPDTEDHPFCRTETGVSIDDDDGMAFKMPTWTNPFIDIKWLERMKKTLIARGEWHVWMREYEAEIVPSGALHIFPMFDAPPMSPDGTFARHTKHVRPHEELIEMVKRHPKDYTFHALYDPASTSCFGALFCAVHKESKQVLILDEIYEQNKKKTSSKQIWPLAWSKKEAIIRRRDIWRDVYDYAAAWFSNEIVHEYGEAMIPCTKDVKDKENKLSSIKDFFLADLILVSDKCKKFVWEARNYATDEHNKIAKKNDHLIDCLRYLFNDAHLHTIPRKRFIVRDDLRVEPEGGYPDFEDELTDDFDPYESEMEDLYD